MSGDGVDRGGDSGMVGERGDESQAWRQLLDTDNGTLCGYMSQLSSGKMGHSLKCSFIDCKIILRQTKWIKM